MMNPSSENEDETFKLAPEEMRPESPYVDNLQQQALQEPPTVDNHKDSQFSLRSIMILMIGAGIVMALARAVSFSAVAFGLGLLALVSLVLGTILGVRDSAAARRYFLVVFGGYLLLSLVAWLQLQYPTE